MDHESHALRDVRAPESLSIHDGSEGPRGSRRWRFLDNAEIEYAHITANDVGQPCRVLNVRINVTELRRSCTPYSSIIYYHERRSSLEEHDPVVNYWPIESVTDESAAKEKKTESIKPP